MKNAFEGSFVGCIRTHFYNTLQLVKHAFRLPPAQTKPIATGRSKYDHDAGLTSNYVHRMRMLQFRSQSGASEASQKPVEHSPLPKCRRMFLYGYDVFL